MSENEGKLKRSLTLLDVIALGVNAVIGQGIFLLLAKSAGQLGPASTVALLLAALLAFLIALCFAEVGSRFRSTGGAYLYARETFGPFLGFEVGWMLCCVAVISWAALSSGFTEVLAYFIPGIDTGWKRSTLSVGLIVGLVLVNLRGAKLGGRLSTVFSIAKLVPLAVFMGVGAFYIEPARFTPFSPEGYSSLAATTLLLLYTFAGFESSVVPAGEMENPQRAVPLALVSVMAFSCFVYLVIMLVAFGTLDDVAAHKNPVVASATTFLGNRGGGLIALGIVISVFGINAASALVGPRKMFAMAQRGDLPQFLAHVDPETGVPARAIIVTAILSAILAVSGKFEDLAKLGVIARFAQYIPTCLAVIKLRSKDFSQENVGFRLPLGPTIPIFTVILCLVLLYQTFLEEPMKIYSGLLAMAIGIPFYLLAQSKRTEPEK